MIVVVSPASVTTRYVLVFSEPETYATLAQLSRGENARRTFQPGPTFSVGISPEGIPLGLERVVRAQGEN